MSKSSARRNGAHLSDWRRANWDHIRVPVTWLFVRAQAARRAHCWLRKCILPAGKSDCRAWPFRRRRRHVIAAREKNNIRHASVHAEHIRIERAHAHGMRDVIKCEVRLTSPNPQPGTKRPSLRSVGIDRRPRSMKAAASSNSWATKASAYPPIHSATGSSPPRWTAFRAIRTASALS